MAAASGSQEGPPRDEPGPSGTGGRAETSREGEEAVTLQPRTSSRNSSVASVRDLDSTLEKEAKEKPFVQLSVTSTVADYVKLEEQLSV